MKKQKGIALVIILIIMMVVAVLGLTIAQNSTTQYKMSAHTQQQGRVYQAARSELEAQANFLNGNFTALSTITDNYTAVSARVSHDGPLVSNVAVRGASGPVAGFDLTEYQGFKAQVRVTTELRIRSNDSEDAETTSTQVQNVVYAMPIEFGQ